MDDFSPFITPALGTAGLVVAAVLMVLRGALVPRATLEMMRADKDREVETWRTLAERSQAVISEQRKQIEMLLEAAQTTRRVIEALPEAARLNREGSGNAMAPSTEE